MKRILFLAACLWLCAWPVAAQTPAEVLQQARAAYDRGDHTGASAAYQTLLNQGLESAELYYNVGNAEFKAGHVGRSIAAYRRALQRAPQDEDIRYNLDYARTFIHQPATRTGLLARTLGNVLTWLSGETLSLAALVVYWILALFAVLLLLRHGRGRVLRWSAAGAGILLFVIAVWASARIMLDRSQRWAVVVASQSEARNGPNAEYPVGFTVPEGREVRVLGHEGDWVAIGLPAEGYKGWVKRADVLEDD
jgi:tetratricopeptide (TPR) repeat protein